MRKATLAALLLAALSARALAQQGGDAGAGLFLGKPIGGTVQYWTRATQGAEAGLGTDDGDFTLWGGYSWYAWDILPQPRVGGKLGLSVGLGGRFRDRRDAVFGFRFPAGMSYWLPRRPIEVFLQAGPRFDVDGDVGFDGGLGVRFTFTSRR